MKILGFLILSIGIALSLVVLYSYAKSQSKFISPVPETDGVRVILISPSQ